MKLLVGTDEAGYGPNLGPLVVAGSAWAVPDDWSAPRLGAFLESFVQSSPKSCLTPKTRNQKSNSTDEHHRESRENHKKDTRSSHAAKTEGNSPQPPVCFKKLPLGDSKLLFQPGSKKTTSSSSTGDLQSLNNDSIEKGRLGREIASVDALSAGVSHLVRLARPALTSSPAACPPLAIRKIEFRDGGLFPCESAPPPWYDDFSNDRIMAAVDLYAQITEVQNYANLQTAMQQNSVAFLGYWYDIVFEDRFNELLQSQGNKASVLTSVCLNLVVRLVDTIVSECDHDFSSVDVWSDRHGGRKRYQSWLARFCSDVFSVKSESPQLSQYLGRLSQRETEWSFICKGDSLIPAAAASMLAKWIREFCMLDFNRYWAQFDSQLKPTAGYPVDAARFANDIARFVAAEKLEKHRWWRTK